MEPANEPRRNMPEPLQGSGFSGYRPAAPGAFPSLLTSRLAAVLTEPSRFYRTPQEAVTDGKNSNEHVALARAALVSYALQSEDYQRQAWYGLFDLDPRGAGVTAAAFALIGDSQSAELAYEALADSNLPLAAACAPVIIAKRDLRLLERALAVLEAYDIGSAQQFARQVDSQGSAPIRDTQERILRQNPVEPRPLPTIPLEVRVLRRELLNPILNLVDIEYGLNNPRVATTPMLASVLHHTKGDLGNWGASLQQLHLGVGLRGEDFSTGDVVRELFSAQPSTPHDFFLSCVTAAALQQELGARLGTELRRFFEEFKRGQEQTARPGTAADATMPGRLSRPHTQVPRGDPDPAQRLQEQAQRDDGTELHRWMKVALDQIEGLVKSNQTARQLNPVFRLVLAQELKQRGQMNESRVERERALAMCGQA